MRKATNTRRPLKMDQQSPTVTVRARKRLLTITGFSHLKNALLYIFFAGALVGFCLARIAYLDVDNVYRKNAGPGEWFWFRRPLYKAGLRAHLAAAIPMGLLVVTQFLPVIRRRWIIVHRVNGYICIVLLVVTNVGALIIVRHAFGGSLTSQTFVGVLALATTFCAAQAYYNVKKLRLDQHRIWMLRTWFYAASIVTLRLIFILSALAISATGGFYMPIYCPQIKFMDGERGMEAFSACRADSEGWAAVEANILTPRWVSNAAASLQVSFGMAGVMAFLIHAVGVEVYLRYTGTESERLAEESLQRRLRSLEAGAADAESKCGNA